MRVSGKIKQYAEKNFNEVYHTTLNPEGPGVVRIHLIPPKVEGNQVGSSVAIVNGQDVIPVNVAWSILLIEFIKEVNRFDGKEISAEDIEEIQNNVCKSVRTLFPFVLKGRLKEDIFTIMNTFKQIAYHEEVAEGIGYMTLGEYAPYMRAPHRMDLLVSAMTVDNKWHCNLKCVHCYAAGQNCSEEKELSTEEWKQIIDKCREAGIPQVTFTGGEPTMRSDLFELIEHAKWFVTRLNTNGLKLTKEYCETLKKASLDSLQITFYSSDEQIHNKLVGVDGYKHTVAAIENALEAGLSVSINTPLCTLNRDYVKTLQFLHEKGVTYVTCSGLITTGNAATQESEGLQLTNAEIRDILKDGVEYCYQNGMEINFTSPGWVDDEFCKELGISKPNCGACLSNMAITPGGNVVPCQSWLSDEPLGNMLKDSWEDIWENETCKERRQFSSYMRCECPLRIPRTGR